MGLFIIQIGGVRELHGYHYDEVYGVSYLRDNSSYGEALEAGRKQIPRQYTTHKLGLLWGKHSTGVGVSRLDQLEIDYIDLRMILVEYKDSVCTGNERTN